MNNSLLNIPAITEKVKQSFLTFGGGEESAWQHPGKELLAEDYVNGPLRFAPGVSVSMVINVIAIEVLEQIEQGKAYKMPEEVAGS